MDIMKKLNIPKSKTFLVKAKRNSFKVGYLPGWTPDLSGGANKLIKNRPDMKTNFAPSFPHLLNKTYRIPKNNY